MTLARVIDSDDYWREVDQLEHDGSTRRQARIDAAKEYPCPTPTTSSGHWSGYFSLWRSSFT